MSETSCDMDSAAGLTHFGLYAPSLDPACPPSRKELEKARPSFDWTCDESPVPGLN
jgi:hypothetical protein